MIFPKFFYTLKLRINVVFILPLLSFFIVAGFAGGAITAIAATDVMSAVDGYKKIKQQFQSRQSMSLKAGADADHLRVIVKAKRATKEPVGLRSGAAAHRRLNSLVRAMGIDVARNLGRYNLLAVSVTEKQFDKLIASGDVVAVREDLLVTPELEESLKFIGGDLVHQAGAMGAGTAVAIFDTGVDSSHPFLGGRVVEESCFSINDPENHLNGLCPNGLGSQIGDGAANGCDMVSGSGACVHGTHVAGIAAGHSNSLFSGVAPAANIVAVQVFTSSPFGLVAYSSDIIAGFDWLINEAKTLNISAVNLSLGGGRYFNYCDSGDLLAPLIATLRVRGVATVISSGNNGFIDSVSWPACLSEAIATGATLANADSIAYYSNRGPLLDLFAPGSDIRSSTPGGFQWMSGTSMAAPHITGAFAVLKSAKRSASIDQLEEIFESTGAPLAGSQAPRINLLAAYQKLVSNESECLTVPGLISAQINNLNSGETKSWNVFATKGGLFRISVTNTSSGTSNSFQLGFNGKLVTLSAAAGQTVFADFANVNAGKNYLSLTSTSNNLSVEHVRVEQLSESDSYVAGECQPDINQAIAIPGVVSDNLGQIAKGTSRSWVLHLNNTGNVRLVLTGDTTRTSGSVMINFNGLQVPVSFAPNQTIQIDFAEVIRGDRALSITATSEEVSIGRVETRLY